MARKPITVARRDYMAAVCEATNKSGLPAFVVVDVLEKVLSELRPAMDAELKRDFAAYEAEKAKETQEGGDSIAALQSVTDNDNDNDKESEG